MHRAGKLVPDQGATLKDVMGYTLPELWEKKPIKLAVGALLLVGVAAMARRFMRSAPLTHKVFTRPDPGPAPAAVTRAVMGGEMGIPRPDLSKIFERDYGEAWTKLSPEQKQVFFDAMRTGQIPDADPSLFPILARPDVDGVDLFYWETLPVLAGQQADIRGWENLAALEKAAPAGSEAWSQTQWTAWMESLSPDNPIAKFLTVPGTPIKQIGTGAVKSGLEKARQVLESSLSKLSDEQRLVAARELAKLDERISLFAMLIRACGMHKIQ